MVFFKTLVISAVTVLGLACATVAEEAFPYLKADAIQSAYATERTGWSDAPTIVLNAFAAGEDRNFFQITPSRSTILRYIAQWYPEPGFPNKRVVAFATAQALEREEILDWYVHRVFLGQGCFGVDDAALAYFGKNTKELALEEVAFLAGLPAAPSMFHPVQASDRALARRNMVLSNMAHVGLISEQEAAISARKPLIVPQPLGKCPRDKQ